jgi:hypothetical protein
MRFEYTLALKLGMTRAELLTRMSGNEFAHWVAYFILERRDEERAMRQQRNRQQALQMSRSARG